MSTRHRGRLFVALAAALAGWARAAEVPAGRKLFDQHCALCHGAAGGGDGPAAPYLFPKPRDFTRGLFKIRTTATGEAPSDQDLLETLGRGLPGSAMPSFSHLPEKDRRDLVRYVKSFPGPEFAAQKPRGISVGEPPPATVETIESGRKAYQNMGCAQCHGEAGRGDGPAAATLKDEWDLPILPANLTRGAFRGGSSVRDIYLRFTTGMNGTPMPSYEDSLSEKERWDLAYYVNSLVRAEKPFQSGQVSRERIAVQRVKGGDLPVRPEDPFWAKVRPVRLPLLHLWQRQEASDALSVRAAHDGKEIAFLLEWEDPKVEGVTLRSEDFADAAGIMFPLSEPAGHFSMGSKGQPVNIWQWRMDRQVDLARFQDVDDAYPAMAVDDYALDKAHGPRGERDGNGPLSPASAQDPGFLAGYAAGNPMSELHRRSAVEDLNAEGFGSLTAQSPEGQDVRGQGIWSQGNWKVVFVRTLPAASERDAPLAAGSRRQAAFAVWDGGAGERNGKKSVTDWQILDIQK